MAFRISLFPTTLTDRKDSPVASVSDASFRTVEQLVRTRDGKEPSLESDSRVLSGLCHTFINYFTFKLL